MIYVYWCVELVLLLNQFSLVSLHWNVRFGTLCYHLIIQSNVSINLNNLLDRLHYLFVFFNSSCLSRSTILLLLNEGYSVIAGEKIASWNLLEKQVHSHASRNLRHPPSFSLFFPSFLPSLPHHPLHSLISLLFLLLHCTIKNFV